ncbi:MAG: GIY-YIG nuclease family protein [Deltaproteobacteria bacterium]
MVINVKTKETLINKEWVVYVLRCKDDTLYTGITNNMEKRLIAHSRGLAAKYTRSRRPVVLSAVSNPMNRADAMRLELRIKKLPKGKKIATLNNTKLL